MTGIDTYYSAVKNHHNKITVPPIHKIQVEPTRRSYIKRKILKDYSKVLNYSEQLRQIFKKNPFKQMSYYEAKDIEEDEDSQLPQIHSNSVYLPE